MLCSANNGGMTESANILYKKKVWLCADEIAMRLLEQFGKVLNERLTPVH